MCTYHALHLYSCSQVDNYIILSSLKLESMTSLLECFSTDIAENLERFNCPILLPLTVFINLNNYCFEIVTSCYAVIQRYSISDKTQAWEVRNNTVNGFCSFQKQENALSKPFCLATHLHSSFELSMLWLLTDTLQLTVGHSLDIAEALIQLWKFCMSVGIMYTCDVTPYIP